MDAVYPAGASALARGRRARRRDRSHLRHRTMPVTFAEIKEVDEESCADDEERSAASAERRRRPDVLDERLGRQFAEFRRRRARGEPLRELSPPAPSPAAGPPARALSEPDALHRQPDAPHRQPDALHRQPDAARRQPDAPHRQPTAPHT